MQHERTGTMWFRFTQDQIAKWAAAIDAKTDSSWAIAAREGCTPRTIQLRVAQYRHEQNKLKITERRTKWLENPNVLKISGCEGHGGPGNPIPEGPPTGCLACNATNFDQRYARVLNPKKTPPSGKPTSLTRRQRRALRQRQSPGQSGSSSA